MENWDPRIRPVKLANETVQVNEYAQFADGEFPEGFEKWSDAQKAKYLETAAAIQNKQIDLLMRKNQQ